MSRAGDVDASLVAELVREGEYWTFVFDERELRVRDSKGLRYLAELLARPGTEIEALALAGGRAAERGSSTQAADAGLSVAGDSGSAVGIVAPGL